MLRALFFISLALIGFLIFPTVREIALIAYNNEDYSHGLILPIISLYLLWIDRERLFALWKQTAPAGISLSACLLMLLGFLVLAAGRITQILFLSWLGVFPLVIGFLAVTLGWRAAVPFIAPVLLLFMAKPIPDSLVPILFFPLQVFAAKVSAIVLEMLNVPVYLVGNIIEIPGMRLMVEEACSGIRSLMALLTVACIVILIVPMKLSGKIVVFAASIVTAILLNIVRVAMTGVLAHFYDPKAATGFFHEFSGFVVFGIGLVAVYGLASLLSVKGETGKSEQAKDLVLPLLSRKGVLIAVLLLLAACSGKIYGESMLSQRRESHVTLSKYPNSIGEWTGREGSRMELRSRETLQLDQYLRRLYEKFGEDPAFLYVGYWGHQSGEYQAAKHSPMMCLPANGWKITKLKPIFVDLPADKKLEVNRVVGQFDQHTSLVFYYFFNGEDYYVREWEALLRIAGNALIGRRTDGGIVEITIELSSEETRQLLNGSESSTTLGDKFVKDSIQELDKLIRAGV